MRGRVAPLTRLRAALEHWIVTRLGTARKDYAGNRTLATERFLSAPFPNIGFDLSYRPGDTQSLPGRKRGAEAMEYHRSVNIDAKKVTQGSNLCERMEQTTIHVVNPIKFELVVLITR